MSSRVDGYTEISGADETQPILSSSSKRGDRDKSVPFRLKILGGTFAVLLVLIIGATSKHFFFRKSQPEQVIQVESVPESEDAYRPFCEYFTDNAPTMLQTSITEPSQQWSKKACFKIENAKVVQLNSFTAADAILKVNFSQPAFVREQNILGFGGAFTEAAALNYNSLTQTGKDAVMELLFGKTGLGYSIGRVPMNSCDFSVKSYSFDETEDDFELEDFDVNVKHDAESGMIGMALRATSVFAEAWSSPDGLDGKLLLYTSPWSPPVWMKKPTWEDDQNAIHAKRMTYSASPNCLREGVGKESRYARAWALYFSKFLTAYEMLGLPMWGITVQNEPEFSAPWEACAYTPDTQRQFVANHLGPRLKRDHPNVKIFIFDHNKDHMNTWAETLLNASSNAANYVDGTAYHWYAGGMDRLLDGALGQPNMHRFQDKLATYGLKESHLILGSESCHCPTTGYAGGDIEIAWARAERYAHTILADLAAGSHGWLEWNLILDGIGGPNHLGNLCETTILAVPHRADGAPEGMPSLPNFETDHPMGNVSIGDGRTREELNALGFPAKYLDVGVAVQPVYFYMGHISRYVRPGSMAVMGLVNQPFDGRRTFRREGQVVVGGGMNDLARTGIELTVWPCEGSTRQQFQWNERTHRVEVFGHDWKGKPTKSCISRKVDKDFLGVRLIDCDVGDAGIYEFIPIPGQPENVYNVILKNHPRLRDPCLVIRELLNNGGAYGPRGGAQVTLGECNQDSARWKVDHDVGEAMSTYFGDGNEVCLTTGWPFLQMGAFVTPNGESRKVVVVLNEANEAANYAIEDENRVVATGSIPKRSIQTVLVD